MGMGMEVEEDESASSSDIVVRDKNGDVELDEPPELVIDDPDEIALDMRQENESACGPLSNFRLALQSSTWHMSQVTS